MLHNIYINKKFAKNKIQNTEYEIPAENDILIKCEQINYIVQLNSNFFPTMMHSIVVIYISNVVILHNYSLYVHCSLTANAILLLMS